MPKSTPSKTDIVPVTPIVEIEEGAGAIDALLKACGVTESAEETLPQTESPPTWDWSKLPLAEGRYEIVSPLAHGGMGALFIAMDQLLGRRVALKVLHSQQLRQPAVVLRFFQEARIHAQFHHAGIPPLHDIGRFSDNRPFIAMKYIEGSTLRDLIEKQDTPDEDRASFLKIFEQVCKIVAYAHAKGVIHRDLTPNNVLVSKRGQVQVIDWGLAKVVKRQPALAVPDHAASDGTTQITLTNLSSTAEGAALGTPAFIPPEQASGRPDLVDRRSDVFGLGAILCHLLTGVPPYTGEMSEIRQRARTGDLGPAMSRLDECGATEAWIALAKECLAAESIERPLNASEVTARVVELLRIPATKELPWWKRLFRS